MRRLGAVGFVVWFAISGATFQKPPTMLPVSVDKISRSYSRGVARIQGGWVLSGPAVIARTDNRFHETQINRHPIPERFLRRGYVGIGDIDVVNTSVYAPLERSDGRGREVVGRYSLKTLRFNDAVELPMNATSVLAIDRLRSIAYTTDSRNTRSLLRFDIVRSWRPLPPLTLDKPIILAESSAVGGGAIWISSSDQTHGIYRINQKSGRVDDITSAGNDTVEGIDAKPLYGASIHLTTVDRNGRVSLWHYKVT